MSKFNLDEDVKKLAPYVTNIQKYSLSTYVDSDCYMGFFKNRPVFKFTDNKIHILNYSKSQSSFHNDTTSIKKAIKLIIESVECLKQYENEKKLKEIDKDFE